MPRSMSLTLTHSPVMLVQRESHLVNRNPDDYYPRPGNFTVPQTHGSLVIGTLPDILKALWRWPDHCGWFTGI